MSLLVRRSFTPLRGAHALLLLVSKILPRHSFTNLMGDWARYGTYRLRHKAEGQFVLWFALTGPEQANFEWSG